MLAEEKLNFIRQKTREHISETTEKILWSLHAVKKLRVGGLRKREVENSLKECIIVEDYKMEGRPLPFPAVLSLVLLALILCMLL